MVKYFVCSIGQPGQDYDDENLRRCVIESGFFLHQNCTQKGHLNDVSIDDILILKYKNNFFAYGRVNGEVERNVMDHGWNIKIPVAGWITGKSISTYGIRNAQIEGNNYEAIKQVKRDFARTKITDIGIPFLV